MSANQIPARRAGAVQIGHTCPNCWKNGGPGHTLAEVVEMTGKVVVRRGSSRRVRV